MLAAISVPMATDARYQWIFTEGHMDCAWHLAERTATLMGADQVRLDIFLARNHPGECSLNENSISSGHPYGAPGCEIWSGSHTLPSYEEKLALADHRPAYDFHRCVLQTLQQRGAEGTEQPIGVKSPAEPEPSPGSTSGSEPSPSSAELIKEMNEELQDYEDTKAETARVQAKATRVAATCAR